MVTPVIFTTFIYNCNAYLDNYLFFTILGWHGENQKALNAAYGEFSNYYVTLINVPLAMASASASAMMPEVSSCYATGDLDEENDKIPSSSSLSGKLLMMGAVSVVFSALSTITNSVLQSIGQQKKALHNAAISLGMDLIVLALILAVFPKTNIYAVVFAGILFSLSMCVLNNLSIRKHLNFRNEFKNTYVKPLIAAAIMGVVTWVVYYGLFAITKRPSISMLIAILIAIVVYLIAFVVVTGTTEAEMRRMPMGTKLVKVLRILRIYR